MLLNFQKKVKRRGLRQGFYFREASLDGANNSHPLNYGARNSLRTTQRPDNHNSNGYETTDYPQNRWITQSITLKKEAD